MEAKMQKQGRLPPQQKVMEDCVVEYNANTKMKKELTKKIFQKIYPHSPAIKIRSLWTLWAPTRSRLPIRNSIVNSRSSIQVRITAKRTQHWTENIATNWRHCC